MYLGLQCVGVSCSNHFLSPAGNAGYSVLVSCSEKIVQSLSEDPKALALHLLSAGLITVSILEKTNEYVNETKREKATRLYTAMAARLQQIRAEKEWEMIDLIIIAKKDAESSKSIINEKQLVWLCALFSLLPVRIASVLVQS